MIYSIHNNGYQSDKITSQNTGTQDTEYDVMNSSSLLVQIDSYGEEDEEKRSRSGYKHSANKIEMSSSREYESIGLEDTSIQTNLQSSASDIRSYFKPWNEAIRDIEEDKMMPKFDDNCSMQRESDRIRIKNASDSCYFSCIYVWKRCLDYILCKNGFYKIKDHDECEECEECEE